MGSDDVMTLAYETALFERAFKDMQEQAHITAVEHGWWDEERSEAECIALMHSELSESLEAIRHNNVESVHIAGFNGMEEEYADVVIRIMDNAQKRGYNVAGAIVAKMAYNESRPYKHGKVL